MAVKRAFDEHQILIVFAGQTFDLKQKLLDKNQPGF